MSIRIAGSVFIAAILVSRLTYLLQDDDDSTRRTKSQKTTPETLSATVTCPVCKKPIGASPLSLLQHIDHTSDDEHSRSACFKLKYNGRNEKSYRFYRHSDDLHFVCCGGRYGTRADVRQHIAEYQTENAKQHHTVAESQPRWMSSS